MADSAELIAHVKDTDAFHLPGGLEMPVPQPFEAIGLHLHLTKFMVLELVVAVLMVAIFVPLGRKLASGRPPRGRLWNLLELILVFVRDEIARPAIGSHDADRFLPFLWSQFFFILFLNLCGLVPWAGSPTGELAVTGAIAVITLGVVVGAGMTRFGPIGFWTGQVPHMDVPVGAGHLPETDDLRHRGAGDIRQALHPGHAFVRQHVCRAPGVGGDHGVHRGGGAIVGSGTA